MPTRSRPPPTGASRRTALDRPGGRWLLIDRDQAHFGEVGRRAQRNLEDLLALPAPGAFAGVLVFDFEARMARRAFDGHRHELVSFGSAHTKERLTIQATPAAPRSSIPPEHPAAEIRGPRACRR